MEQTLTKLSLAAHNLLMLLERLCSGEKKTSCVTHKKTPMCETKL